MNIIYPPTGQEGKLVNTLNELPERHWIEDYNEFYRLYKDEHNNLYVYKIKQPKSAADGLH